MFSYFLKTANMIFIVFLFFSCSKNPTENGDDNDIVEPEIVYISETFEPVYKKTLILIDANGNNRRDIFSTSQDFIWDPNFSPDGKSIIFVLEVDEANVGTAIYKIDLNGKNLIKISESHVDDNYPSYEYPQFLPDGIHIVYRTRVDVQDYEIRILNCETKEDRLLVKGYLLGFNPAITGDGQWIVFWENSDLYKIHFTGGEKSKITDGNAAAQEFDLNKMANEIVFLSFDASIPNELKLAKINLDGSNYIRYNFSGQYPKISSDGSNILFIAVADDKSGIWIADADRSTAKIVTTHNKWDYFVQFYPSSDRILIVREVNDWALYSCGLSGEDLKQLTPFDYYPLHCPQFKP